MRHFNMASDNWLWLYDIGVFKVSHKEGSQSGKRTKREKIKGLTRKLIVMTKKKKKKLK